MMTWLRATSLLCLVCLSTLASAQLDGQDPSVINLEVHPLPVSFDNVAFDDDHLSWTVTAPYLDYTWAGAPEFQSNEDLLGAISPDPVTGANPVHPVMLGYLDFSVGLDGPHTTPRTSAYHGSCAQALAPTDLGGDNYDTYLRSKMTDGKWVNATHPGQYVFDTVTHVPPVGGWTPDSQQGLDLMSAYTVMSLPSASGTVGTAGTSPYFTVTGLTPSSDLGGRHMLTYHVSSTLTALRLCTASAEQTPVTGANTLDGKFLALFADEDEMTPPNSRYTVYPTWVGLEPTTVLGAQGGMHSVSQRVELTISSVGWAAQISGAGRALSVSIVDAVTVSGNFTSHVGDTQYGCPTVGGNDYGRVLLELEFMHTKEDRFNLDEVVGVEKLSMIQPSIASPFVSEGYENCYGMPIDNSMDSLWKYQSLDNWVMSNRRLPGGSRAGAADLTMVTCNDPLSINADPFCNENGAPFCPQGTVNGHGVCFQRVLLTSQCLPLNTNGNTMTLDSVCPHGVDTANEADGTANANDHPGSVQLEFPVTVCSSLADWKDKLDGTATDTQCTKYDNDPDKLVINLSNLNMFPPLRHQDRIDIDMQFLLGPDSNTFDDGLSPISDLSNPAVDDLLEPRLIARYEEEDIVTVAVRARNDEFLTLLPISITRITICRGDITDMKNVAVGLENSATFPTSDICGVGVTPFVFYDSALGFVNDCGVGSNEPCVDPTGQPKIDDVDEISDNFQICNNPSEFGSGLIGCDATSIEAAHIVGKVGPLEGDEVYLTIVEVYVAEAQSSARRRMLSLRQMLSTSSVSPGGGTVVGGQLFTIDPAGDTTVEGVGTFSIKTEDNTDVLRWIVATIILSVFSLLLTGLFIQQNMENCGLVCQGCCCGDDYNKLGD